VSGGCGYGKPMTTRLKLICHSSTVSARNSAFPDDEPLDHFGLKKLNALSRRHLRADRYVTSPALRATQTAEGLRLNATVEPRLAEYDYGSWAGRSLDDLNEREPEGLAEWLRNPGSAPHGGETVLALIERVAAWLDAQLTLPGMAVAITHASVIRAAIVCAIEAEPRSFWRIDVAPLSLTRLSGDRGHWTLASISTMDESPPDS
jgi:broad specificity phosphatase PhoE